MDLFLRNLDRVIRRRRQQLPRFVLLIMTYSDSWRKDGHTRMHTHYPLRQRMAKLHKSLQQHISLFNSISFIKWSCKMHSLSESIQNNWICKFPLDLIEKTVRFNCFTKCDFIPVWSTTLVIWATSRWLQPLQNKSSTSYRCQTTYSRFVLQQIRLW